MSITKAAELVRAHGRGKDSQLMHVTPRELQSLQAIARAKGGSLTINPNTGLPEAGFLEDVLPTVAGTLIGTAVGMPWLGAAIGGLGTYAMTGSLEKGLMSGLGAFGGASALSSLGGIGAAAAAPTTATTAATTSIAPEALAAAADAGLTGVGANVGAATAGAGMTPMQLAGAYDTALSGVGANMPTLTGAEQFAQMGVGDKFSAVGKGFGQLFSDPSGTMKALPKGFVGDVGMAAAPIIGGIMDSSSSGMPEPEEQDSYYRPFNYDPKTQKFTALPPVKTSDWGSRSFEGYRQSLGYAEGGEIEQRYERPIRTVDPAVADYNRAMMERAQQEYVQGMQMPGVQIMQAPKQLPADAASITPTGKYDYDPVTQRYSLVQPTKSEIDKLREELLAQSGQQNWHSGMGWNPYADTGHGGAAGVASGGYIKNLASGGAVGIAQIPKFQAGGEMSSDAFVVPADVVSALGNGSTDAGVRALNDYLGMAMHIEGEGDGLSDDVPASIEGEQPARVADGEVYVPPEVVAELGDGDPEKGAAKLYVMMDKIREAAHGKKSQQREVSPDKVMPV